MLTPEEAWALIEKIASNDQQFEGLDARQVHEVSHASRSSKEHDNLSYQMIDMRTEIGNEAL